MAKIKNFFRAVGDVLDDVLAYVLTVIGILFSNVVPLLKSNEPLSIDIGAMRIVAACIVAILFVSNQESVHEADGETKAKAKEKQSEDPDHGSTGVKNHSATPAAVRFYLNVPIEEKDAAKTLGARWDGEHKQWWCHPTDKEKCRKWWPAGA